MSLYFLGFTIRQFRAIYGLRFSKLSITSHYNTYLYPSKKTILRHQRSLHHLILVQGRKFGQRILIGKLNLIIKAWISYFGNFNSNLTGHIVKQDYLLYLKLSRWVKRQKGSLKKGLSYWQTLGSNNWIFMTKDRKSVLKYHLYYI
jgi:RNA-directed DNA polymerase